MMSSPSDRTQRVYGVSFSAANFWARSSETTASLAMCPCRALLVDGGALALQVRVDDLRVQLHARVVFRRVLDLLEVVQPARLEDAVDDRDQAHRPVGARVEVLVDRVRRHVDHVARLPL